MSAIAGIIVMNMVMTGNPFNFSWIGGASIPGLLVVGVGTIVLVIAVASLIPKKKVKRKRKKK